MGYYRTKNAKPCNIADIGLALYYTKKSSIRASDAELGCTGPKGTEATITNPLSIKN